MKNDQIGWEYLFKRFLLLRGIKPESGLAAAIP